MFFFKKKQLAPGPVEWLIAGLGNPGPKYERTRHNVGFLALDMLANRIDARVDRLKFKSLYARATFEGIPVLLLKPQTFMNLSGDAILDACEFFKIPSERVVVIYDDVSLPVGKIRVRSKGSDGGHNGIKSIILSLNTDVFPRVKIGIGQPDHQDYMVKDWVLANFGAEDIKQISDAIERSVDAALAIVREGSTAAANKFNGS